MHIMHAQDRIMYAVTNGLSETTPAGQGPTKHCVMTKHQQINQHIIHMIHFPAKQKTTHHLRSHTSRTVNTITVSHQQLQEVTKMPSKVARE